MEQRVLDVLRRRDPEAARALLAEVHREKAFSMADLEAGVEADIALYHAYHVALLSLVQGGEVEVEPDSITGLDFALAVKFAQALGACGRIEGSFDEFFTQVVQHLNRLAASLCR